jgi:tRNA(Ile)-lysidine synthase
MERIINILSEKIKPKETVVVAVSGGPDSMLLLQLLLELRKKKDISIVCTHINHGVRKQSEKEKIFVEKFCNGNDIIFEYSKIQVALKNNFHSEARKLRYHFFEHVVFKYNAKFLLTAHHGDDLMETILMRLTRGSSLKGYAGFRKETKKDKYSILRPLIEVSKADIISYCKKNNIKYAIDLSNYSSKYTRNRFRKSVIPFLKKEDENVIHKFIKFSENIILANDYIDEVATEKHSKLVKKEVLEIDKFKKENPVIKRRIISKMIENKYKEMEDINDNHIEKCLSLIESKKTNSSINLPNDLHAYKNYGKFYIEKKEEYSKFVFELKENLVLPNGKKISFLTKTNENSNSICRLNKEDIVGSLWVRSKKDGDRIDAKGLKGTKKISDIFIDEKIDLNDRKAWPIVVDDNNNVLWVPGLKKSKKDKDKSEKCDIILKYH